MVRRELKRLGVAACWAMLLGAERGAAAASPGSAEQLFERGVVALRAGDFATACPAIEGSYAAERTLGTLLALADCLEQWGKLNAAALRYEQIIAEISKLEASERSYRAAQLEYAEAAALRLRQSVPELVLSRPAHSATELELYLDDRQLPLPPPEQALPIDPGTHTLETRAAGRAPWRITFEVTPGERRHLELELGATLARRPPPPTLLTPPAPREPAREPPGSAWRSIGWGLGAVGVAGAVAGTLSGALLLDACPNLACTAGDRRARDLALATDIGFGVAVVGLASAAIILVQTSPAPDRAARAGWQPVAAITRGSAWLGLNQPW